MRISVAMVVYMKEGSVVEISFPSKPIFDDARRCDMYDDDDDHAAVADYK